MIELGREVMLESHYVAIIALENDWVVTVSESEPVQRGEYALLKKV